MKWTSKIYNIKQNKEIKQKLNLSITRFRHSLPEGTRISNYANQDEVFESKISRDMHVIKRHQDEVFESKISRDMHVLKRQSNKLAIALSSKNVHNIDKFLKLVAKDVVGLFIYDCPNLNFKKAVTFFEKASEVTYLTLCRSSIKSEFLLLILQQGLLPKLRFLETDDVNDEVLAALSSSPYLNTLILTQPKLTCTTNGFQQLYDSGGGKSLINVSTRFGDCFLSKDHLPTNLNIQGKNGLTASRMIIILRSIKINSLPHSHHSSFYISSGNRLRKYIASINGKFRKKKGSNSTRSELGQYV